VEIRLIGGGEAEAELGPHTPLSPSCEPGCSCVCHLQWPGMKLVWVPVDTEDAWEGEEGEDEEEEEEEADVEEHRTEEEEDWEEDAEVATRGDEVDRMSVIDERDVLKQDKVKFHHCLDVLIADGHRRLSDPGPRSVLAFLAATRSQSPRVPPKRAQSPHVASHASEEENVYEATLPVGNQAQRKSKELDIPVILVRKPPRQSRLTYSASDPTSEFQTDGESIPSPDDVPPAVPPRMPVIHAPVHRGVALPQATAEEWRNLRPSSPGGLSPQMAGAPTPPSPHRPPPPPPKTDPRRLSSASMQSLTQKKGSLTSSSN